MDVERVREYVRLRRQQRERQAEVDTIKEAADALEQQLLEEFATDGVQNISVDGNVVYLRRQLWARVAEGASRDEVIDGLRRAGLDHFVTEGFNTSTISSWMRELEAEGDELPQELEGLLAPVEKYNVLTRRS